MFPNTQDCIKGSLDKLDLSKLLKSASKNEQCLEEARSVFKRMHAFKFYRISGPFVKNGNRSFYGTIITEIRNFDVAKQFLRAFGRYIHNLSVYFHKIGVNEGKEIVKHINDECSNSTTLDTLTLQECANNMLDDLQSNFSSISILTFSSSLNNHLNIRSDAPKMTDIFPNLNTLHLGQTIPSDWKFIGKTFPCLNFLRVELESKLRQNFNIDEQVINFLKENSNIPALSISYSNLKFLKECFGILPHIEQLELTFFSKNYNNYEGEPIRFEKLKGLTIESLYDDVYLEHIHFDQLQNLNMDVQPKFNQKWSEFVNQQVNANISTLKLTSGRLTNKHILGTAEQKPNLKVAEFNSDLNITADTVLEFVKKSEHLRELELNVPMIDVETLKLHENIPHGWKIDFHGTKDKFRITLEKSDGSEAVDGDDDMDDDDENPEDNKPNTSVTHSMQTLTIALICTLANLFSSFFE